jgi:hypothetical protein
MLDRSLFYVIMKTAVLLVAMMRSLNLVLLLCWELGNINPGSRTPF